MAKIRNMTPIRENIITEAKRLEEDAQYSSKGQYNAASIWGVVHFSIGIPAAILSAIAGASALYQFDSHEIVAAMLSLIVAALTAILTFLNPNRRQTTHQNAGGEYNSLRNRARIFRTVDIHTLDDAAAAQKLGALDAERSELNKKSPAIPRIAFTRARKGIEEGEATYAADK